MPYSFDDINVIDLERALDEGRITPFVDNKSYKISLKSVDDDVLNNITRSLVTPIPQNDRPASRTESVMLFKNLINGKEPVTVDFVSSDLNDFIGNFPMDDLLSRPGSRVPSISTTTPPPPLYSYRHDSSPSLLSNSSVKYNSDLHEFSPLSNDDISNQGYVRDNKRHLPTSKENHYPLHIQGYTDGFTRRRSSPSLIDTTKHEQKRDRLLSAVEKSIRLEELKQMQQRKMKNEHSFDKAHKRYSLSLASSTGNIRDTRRWSSSAGYLPEKKEEEEEEEKEKSRFILNRNDTLYYQQQQQSPIGRNNLFSQRRQSELVYTKVVPKTSNPILENEHNYSKAVKSNTIPIAEIQQLPQKPRLLPQRGGGATTGGKPLLKNHIETMTHRNRAYSMPTTEHISDAYKKNRKTSSNNTTIQSRQQQQALSYIPQPRRRSSRLFENDSKLSSDLYYHSESSTSTSSSGNENMTLNRQKTHLTRNSSLLKQEKQRFEQKRHSFVDQSIPRGDVFRQLPPKDRRQRVLSDGSRTDEKKGSTVVEDAKNVLAFVRQRRKNTMSKR